MEIEKVLLEFSKQELSNLIKKLLQKLNEKERTDFIAKFISAEIALTEIGEEGSSDFLKKVEDFCVSCLNGDYYMDPEDPENYDYNYRYDYYDDYDPSELYDDSDSYYSFQNLLNLLSFEGRIRKLIDVSKSYDGYSQHDYLEYTSKSLIYRAIGLEEIDLPNLKDYIDGIKQSNLEGIYDMMRFSEDKTKHEEYLNLAIDVFKIMVQFHIYAAKRTRYARAAYYCSVIKDICTLLDKDTKFIQYYNTILLENKNRRALKEEMRSKIEVYE